MPILAMLRDVAKPQRACTAHEKVSFSSDWDRVEAGAGAPMPTPGVFDKVFNLIRAWMAHAKVSFEAGVHMPTLAMLEEVFELPSVCTAREKPPFSSDWYLFEENIGIVASRKSSAYKAHEEAHQQRPPVP